MKQITLFLIFLFLSQILTGQIDLRKNYSYDSLEKLLGQARQRNDHQMLADVYFLLAKFEKEKLRNDEQAFEYYTRSLDYYKILADTDQIFVIKRAIAKRYLETGLYSQAIEEFRQILDYYEDAGSLDMQTRVSMDLAAAYRGKGDTESEILFESKALNLNLQLRDTSLNVEILLQKIGGYLTLNEPDSALVFLKQAKEESRLIRNASLLCRSLSAEGKILSILGKDEEAIQAFERGIKVCGQKAYDPNRLMIYKAMANSLFVIEDYERAYYYKNRYALLNDSMLNYERITSLNNLTFKFESKEKNKAVKLLELENINAKQRNIQQKRALYVLGIGLGLLLALLYYIIRFYNQRIKASFIINKQKEEINNQKIAKLEDDIKIRGMQSMIEGQEIERERIAKDLHDSLGGLLSTVKLQFDSVESKVKAVGKIPEYSKAHNLLDTAVKEVRSISQNLQPNSLERMGLISAIKDLINRFDGNNYPEIDFQHYQFPDDIDKMTSLSIYRMIQELLYNAAKHAEATEIMLQLTKEEGEIVVHLEDDGIGFNPKSTRSGAMGLENIQSRVDYLKGSFSIDTKKGEGSSFVIHIPYEGN